MKKTAIFLTLTALAFLLGGCYIAPVPPPPGVRPAVRVHPRPVVVPPPRVVVPVPPPPVLYYP